MSYVFKVEDMTCGGCAASIKRAVSRIPGINSVDANPSNKDVIVDASSDVSREEIVVAINAAGYTQITSVEA
ncbi:MAG TPA: heavy metal-associated domain-containing protein [Roseiflexaceae bacterium]|nr:heavy metal-associated domain-containing protein [Roseiflexaceae bacterium]